MAKKTRQGKNGPKRRRTSNPIEPDLQHLEETCVVSQVYEFRRALDENLSAFRDSVAKGESHRAGIAVTGSAETVRHRAEKTGRNAPCPCGSGKKFKKCCMRL